MSASTVQISGQSRPGAETCDHAADDWQLRVGPDEGRRGLMAVSPAGGSVRIHERDCLYRREVLKQEQGRRWVEYRRRKVQRFVERGGTWYVEFAGDYDLGRRRRPALHVAVEMATGSRWAKTSPEGFDGHRATWRTWEEIERADMEIADLEFRQLSGRGSRTRINHFLEGGDDGRVDHALGGVQKWKAAFVAEFRGEIISAAVTHFYHPSQNGEELCITRLANHPDAPPNTSSWMIANVRDWASEQGYNRLATYAGVGDNAGTCYRAAGLDPVGDPTDRDQASWESDDDIGRWRRQKWATDL